MYPSKGSNPYGQQSYGAQQSYGGQQSYGAQQSYGGQQSYGQISGSGYAVNQVGGSESGPQHALVARQSSMMGMGAAQDTDMTAYRNHASQASQYGGPYASVYGSSNLNSAQQVGGVSGKAAVSSSLQGRTTYPSALAESSKFSSGALGSGLGMTNDDYLSASNRGYTQKGDQFSSVKNSDFASTDRRHYGEHQGAYIGRELQSDSARRYGDSGSLSHPHQSEMHDQASLLRQQQMLKVQSLQSGSDIRQADYYAVRAAPIHHGPQEVGSYGGRMDTEPRSLSILGSAPYGGQHAASILGGAPRRNVDELIYAQGSSSAGYGVGLPPGRDYLAGKGLRGSSLESDYQGSLLSRAHPSLGASMLDERKDDRNAYRRELEIREEERRRELVREREKREREERDRERNRERERDRLREHRDKDKERDRKHPRREWTPPRATRDRRGSSTLRDEKPLRRVSPRRVSPRREAVHRHRSPVKEKKREYICKVYPFCLVDVERDYLSLSKRYPRLAIAPDFSKVILNWPRESLNLSLHTPVSFEHDLLEVDDKAAEKGRGSLDELLKSNGVATVWNAKVILMSGASSGALNELCLDKSADERIMHFNNILKFGILRKDRAFMAIGGPWNVTVDGGDPSVDDSSLIQTAIRCVKDLTQLDLHNCQHWNRFLEIHYDRVGKDGFFSHKEVTVLFVPDLSECLPSVDLWRNQWIAHKEDMAEREQGQEKKSGEKKEGAHGVKGDGIHSKSAEDDSAKLLKAEDCPDEKVTVNTDNISGSNKSIVEQKGKEPVLNEKISEKDIKGAADDKVKIDEKIIHDGSSGDPAVEVQMPAAKKKTVRKVVKTKVVGKKVGAATEISAAKLDEKMDVKDEGDKQNQQENAAQEDESSAELLNAKTSVRKKVVRRVAGSKSAQKEDKTIETSDSQSEKKSEKEPEHQDDQANDKKEKSATAVLQPTGDETPGKRKIVRKVIKRKVLASEDKDMKATNMNAVVGKEDDAKGQAGKKDVELVESSNSANKTTEVSKVVPVDKESLSEKKIKEEKKDKKECSSGDSSSKADKAGSKGSSEPESAGQKDSKKDGLDTQKRIKDEKEKKNKDVKLDSKEKLHKEGKEKGNSEEPPKHPGFFLQAKRSRGSKIRSISLSLDGLLDYNDKDIEESTFELSLFAESFNEMLQYQMGCRILSFLEKLRKKLVLKRNQRKRERDGDSEKGNGKGKSSVKRPKTSEDSPVENERHQSEIQDTSNKDNEEKKDVDDSAAGSDEPKIENRTEDDVIEEEEYEEEEEFEDPEEIIEEDQEMDDAAASDGEAQEDVTTDGAADSKAGSGKTREHGNSKKSANEKSGDEAVKVDEKSDKKKEQKHPERDASESVKEEVIDKELLQAFRFFDRNCVGFIKVEDLRCIIHNMGKFLSNRDVKELVQSALFESNSARDNRIFYKKLVKLTDL